MEDSFKAICKISIAIDNVAHLIVSIRRKHDNMTSKGDFIRIKCPKVISYRKRLQHREAFMVCAE